MNLLLLGVIFILGLCFGSFVNMLVYRLAVDYKLEGKKFKVVSVDRDLKNRKRSFCDYCGRQLSWYENIPVVSWFLQKGKTKCCQRKLSILYPIVEMLMASLFVIFFRFWSSDVRYQTLELILGLVIVVFLVFSAVFDFKYMILPDFSTRILLVSAFILLFFQPIRESPLHLILSTFGSFGFLGFLYLITQKKGMGYGDVKLAFFMGLFLGYPKIVVAFYVAFVVGAVVSLILIILKIAKRKTLIPFGPFLILGTFVAWWWGESLFKLIIINH